MNPLISIIVPIYNTEKYLSCCVDSILNQTFENFELLLINDGSSDGSGEICDKYAQLDIRIKVIHKSNTGVSDARNCALDIAVGKYVIFVDADDYWCMEDALERLYDVAEQYSLDIVRGEYKAVDEQGNLLFSRSVSKYRMKYVNLILSAYEFLKYIVHGEFFLWLCLIRKDVINDLRFESGRIFLEDMQFLSKLLVKDVCCMYVPDVNFYIYRIYSSSASNRFLPQRINDILVVCDTFYSLSRKVKNSLLRRFLVDKSLCLFCLSLSYLSLDEYYTHKEMIIERYRIDVFRTGMRKRMFENRRFSFSPVYYIPVIWVVRLYRINLLLARTRCFILKKIKVLLGNLLCKCQSL